jgi:AraC-like DNA-binding protein
LVRRISQSDIRQNLLLWTRGTAAREALAYLDRIGIDAEPLLSKAELSRDQLLQDRGGLSAASQYRFLELAASETNDSLLGLRLAVEMDLRVAGILFYLAASSATVAEALDHLVRYAATTSEDIRPELSQHNGEMIITSRHVLAIDDPYRQFSEFLALGLIRVLHRVTNRDFAPSRITFVHARNFGLKEVHRLLRCPVEFLQPANSWVLPQSVMELPIVSQDSHLLHILRTHADDLLAQRQRVGGLRSVVENHLESVLPSGKVRAAVVAQQLGMSLRSLARQLAAEGASFGEILDHLRNRLAVRYLEDQRISLQQIAWLLGYSELAAFNHAFKRWSGTSPGRARNQPTSIPPA